MRPTPASRPCDRRSFLAGLAGGAAALAAGRTLAAASPAWKMRLSGSSINFTKLTIEDACQRLAALGCEAIDVWSAHAGCPHLDDVAKRLGPAGLTELLAKHKLKLYAFSVYSGGYPRYAELLGQAGGGLAVRGSSRACAPAELQQKMRQFLDALKPELELAEKYNSQLAIENHGNALLDSLDSFKAFVDLNRHPRLGIALAPYHVKGSVEETIRAVGSQLLFFYAWQNAPGVGQLPGHGPADCTPWLAALAQVKYQGYVNPFLHHEPSPDETSAALAKSIAYLRDCEKRALA